MATGDDRLREAIRLYRRERPPEGGVAPACGYGQLVGDRLDNLAADVEDVRNEVRWVRRVILTGVVGGAFATLARMLGWVQ